MSLDLSALIVLIVARNKQLSDIILNALCAVCSICFETYSNVSFYNIHIAVVYFFGPLEMPGKLTAD